MLYSISLGWPRKELDLFLSLSEMVSRVRCGTVLYLFLIFDFLFTLIASTVLGINETVHCNYLRSWITRRRLLVMDYLWTPYVCICKKAFHFVPHKRLMLKLERLGIIGDLLRWIKNLLSERKQRAVLNGISSDWTDVISGDPQGSVLGPMLFILYVNDLPDKVKSYCKIFADDTKVYKEINNLKDYEDLQDDIYELCRWTTKWLLFFNANKCKLLHIRNNNPRFEYEMTDKNYNKVNIKLLIMRKILVLFFKKTLN